MSCRSVSSVVDPVQVGGQGKHSVPSVLHIDDNMDVNGSESMYIPLLNFSTSGTFCGVLEYELE